MTTGAVATGLAILTLAASPSSARMSAQTPSDNNTVTSGTVTLATTTNTPCTASNMAPGDSSTCTLTVTYGGNANAYMALDVLVATRAGSGGTQLFTPDTDTTHDLQVTIQDNQGSPVTYVSPSTSFGAGVACDSIADSGYDATYTCYRLTKLLTKTTAFAAGNSLTFTTTLAMPASTNAYQGGVANVVLTAHVANSANNPTAALTCTPGASCTQINWS